jgi:hypothetical protein
MAMSFSVHAGRTHPPLVISSNGKVTFSASPDRAMIELMPTGEIFIRGEKVDLNEPSNKIVYESFCEWLRSAGVPLPQVVKK